MILNYIALIILFIGLLMNLISIILYKTNLIDRETRDFLTEINWILLGLGWGFLISYWIVK